jgi:hypothetical protein
MARDTFTLGGRLFTIVEGTSVEHDEFMEARLHPAGLHNVTMEIGEDPESFWRRMMMRSAETGVRRELLGGLIMPADAEKWTPQIAIETAAFLGQLTDEDDKRRYRIVLVTTLFRFFEGGISSLFAYASSLEKDLVAGPETTETDNADRGGDGQSSSEPSPGTTTIAASV